MIGRRRLDIQHIQRRAADHPRAQGLGQRRVIHHRAACGVYQQRVRLHACQSVGIDQALGVRGQRHVQRQHINLRQQVIQGNPAGTRLASGALRDQHLHAEGARQTLHAAAELTVTDDPKGHAAQLAHRVVEQTKLLTAAPVATPDGGTVIKQTGVVREDQHHHVLRHAVGGVSGDIADHDAQAGRSLEIDVVGAGGNDAHQFQIRCGLQRGRIQDHLIHDHHAGIGNACAHLPGRGGGVKLPFGQCLVES